MSIDKKVSHSIEHNTAVIFNAMTTARAIDQVVVFTIPDDLMEQVSKWVDGSHSYNAVRTFVRHNLTNYDTVRTAMAIRDESAKILRNATNRKIDQALEHWHCHQVKQGYTGLKFLPGRPGSQAEKGRVK